MSQRKTVDNPDEGATTNEPMPHGSVQVAPLGVIDSDADMRGHGAHVWTSASGQTFWCFCENARDHKTEPRWA